MPLIAEAVTVFYPKAPRAASPALDGVSCRIVPGQVTAIVGPNGAGKSTLLRALSGVRVPQAGRVLLDDRPLASMRPRDRARRIALAVQQPAAAFGFSARRVISFGAEGAGSGRSAVEHAVGRFGIADIADQPFDALSVGERQRVSLARVFAQLGGRPDVFLLADEPISAMDPRHASEAIRAIRELADGGAGVGIVLHDLSVAACVADRAVLLGPGGTVLADGSASSTLSAASLSELYGTPMVRGEADGIGTIITHKR